MWRDGRRLSWAEAKEVRAREAEAARAARAKLAMTCQVCGRDILANKGRIAHHGYQRPGDGWQTASCHGALKLPFEVDRAALGEEIVFARAYVERTRAQAEAVRTEQAPTSIKYQVYEGERGRGRFVDKLLLGVTRDTWEQHKIDTPEAFKNKHGPYHRRGSRYDPYTFEVARDDLVSSLEYQAKRTETYADQQQRRYDRWKQTHERRDDQWVKIRKGKK